MRTPHVILTSLIFLASLTGAAAAPPAAKPAHPAPPVFTDVTAAAGITFAHSIGDHELTNIVEGTGSGACFFDYDGDGWLDIYFPNGAWERSVSDNRGRDLIGKLANVLYHNNGDGTFTDVTAKAGVGDKGYGVGCSAADFDGDGDVDLYVLNYGPNVLYRNEGNGTFTDVSERSGLADPHWSVSASWFDYDGDGDLDVYVANYLQYDDGKFRSYYAAAGYPGPLSYEGQPDALYRNNGDGTFTDVTKEAGVFNPDGRAMSATVDDINGDGILDIYVANDAMGNFYYQGTGKGTFEEKGLFTGLAFGEHGQGVSSMGPVVGDVNGDGRPDIYIPDMGYGSLLMNGGANFEDRVTMAGLAVMCGQYTGWGAVLFDYDNDGDLDLFIANGNAHHEYSEEDVLAANDGKGTFSDVASSSGAWFQEKHVGRGATWADYDNDGDVDLLVVNLDEPAHLLRNDGGNARSWLGVRARLPGGKVDAIGARLTVTAGSLRQTRDLVPVTGYLSQGDPRVHFGLGENRGPVELEIRWPDGSVETVHDVAIDRYMTLVEKPGRPGR
ncbi:MAG TPA: CRTAC1 family protein [Candidatus Saccharimonadales bacterium]|nr:CRTAC1 family protein [Candidatus Saccharimonadales bacterium]